MVVRLIGAFPTGAVRGLKTEVFQSSPLSLFTIRRAWLAEKSEFSLGGLPDEVAVGLRRRCVRDGFVAVIEEERLSAERIFFASPASIDQDFCWFSSSDDEPTLSGGVTCAALETR